MGYHLEQLCLFPERTDKPRAALHGTQPGSRSIFEMHQVARAEVWYFMGLQVPPDALNRVEFGCIGRKILKGNLSIQLLNKRSDELGAMGLQTIPDDQKLAANRVRERFQELHDLRTADGAGEQPEIEAHETHSGDHRELLPAETVLQDRSLAPRSPRSRATGTFGQARLIDEHDDASLPRGYFFSAGHLVCFQVAMAGSSRWRAWPVGR